MEEKLWQTWTVYLKSRDIILLTKVHRVKAMVFPVIMYGRESWTIKEAESRRITALELWCWWRLLRVPDTGKDWGREEEQVTEDEGVGWHHWLNGHQFEQTLGDNEGQGSMVCFSPSSCKELDMTEWLNNNKYSSKNKYPSVQFSRSVMSDSLWPHGLLYARLPCPSPTPGVYSNLCPLSRWCHEAISSSVTPFFSHLESFRIRVFSKESVLRIRWPKYWSFSFSISS